MAFYKQNMTAFFTPKQKLSKGSIQIGGWGSLLLLFPACFNPKINGDLIITEFSTLSQKTIKETQGYRISAVVGKYSDTTPVTFIGQKAYKNCVGTIDAQGNSQILQEFDYNDNESMNGFLMELQ